MGHELRRLEEALHEMLAALDTIASSVMLPLDRALGRILAIDVISPVQVPPFDNSAMDGYALRHADLAASSTLRLQGRALAGHPYIGGSCLPGHAIRIMTGAPLPEGTDTVVRQEDTDTDTDGIRVLVPVKAGTDVRRCGEDIRRGDVVLSAGLRLTARELPLLASLGIHELAVRRPLRVALLSTGDELKPVGTQLAAGEIYDSNRYGVRAMLERLGVDCLDLGIIPDDPALLRTAFERADREADVLITSGGVSVGDADYTKQLLDELGQIGFWKLALKPGKPFAFGHLSKAWFFGLPGNPVSAMVTFDQLVRPALARLAGEVVRPPLRCQAVTKTALKKKPGLIEFQRGILIQGADGLEVTSTGAQGSGVFSSFSRANCYIILEHERGAVAAGEPVTVELLGSLMQ